MTREPGDRPRATPPDGTKAIYEFLRGVGSSPSGLLSSHSTASVGSEGVVLKISTLTLLLLLLAAAVSAADSSGTKKKSNVYKEKIVVTASAIPEKVTETPASATVITHQEIEARGALDLVDVLREVPGLSLARYGSSGKSASLFVRGGSSQQTAVLWNGIEINDPYFAGYDWGQFSTEGIDRIEIVRGPYSALYGSDAMSGVVNIITSTPPSGLMLDVSGGERGLFDGRLGGSMSAGPWSVGGTFERRVDNGWFPNDDLARTSMTGTARWSRSRSLSVGLVGRWNDYSLGVPFNDVGADHLVATPSRRQSGNEFQVAVPVEGRVGRLKWDATVSESDHDITLRDPQDPYGLTFQITKSVSRRARGSLTVPTSFGTIVTGVEAERSRVDDDTTYGVNLAGETRTSRSVFVEDRLGRALGRGRMELSAGARWDDYDTFGSELSPRVAAAWIVGANKIHAAWGRAFRAPAIGELYYPFAGNPSLDPERSRSLEVGYERTLGRGLGSITWFESSYDNLIVYDNGAQQFANTGAATTKGIELALDQRIASAWRAGLSYTWLETRQADTGAALLRRPRNSGSVHVGWDGARLSAFATVVRTGSRADILPVFPYDRIVDSAWTSVDLRLGWRVGGVEPYVRVENLLDERYQEIAGFPAPGRRAIVGLRYIR